MTELINQYKAQAYDLFKRINQAMSQVQRLQNELAQLEQKINQLEAEDEI